MQISVFISLGYMCLEVGLLGHMVKCTFNFRRNRQFFKAVAPMCFEIRIQWIHFSGSTCDAYLAWLSPGGNRSMCSIRGFWRQENPAVTEAGIPKGELLSKGPLLTARFPRNVSS